MPMTGLITLMTFQNNPTHHRQTLKPETKPQPT
jgi:hypothetical protein